MQNEIPRDLWKGLSLPWHLKALLYFLLFIMCIRENEKLYYQILEHHEVPKYKDHIETILRYTDLVIGTRWRNNGSNQ